MIKLFISIKEDFHYNLIKILIKNHEYRKRFPNRFRSIWLNPRIVL